MNRELLDKITLSEENVNENLICVFCEKILLNPQQIRCGHRTCTSCLEVEAQSGNNRCPLCKSALENAQFDYAAVREINEMVVSCPMKSCFYVDQRAPLSHHIDNCGQSNGIMKSRQQTVRLNRSDKMDINDEIKEMKRNIASLMGKNDQMYQLTNECHNLRTMIDDSVQRNEKSLNDLSDEMQENYKKIEMSILSSSDNSPRESREFSYLRKELDDLRSSYGALEEYIKSLNKFNKKIKESVSELYTQVKAIDDEKTVNFRQFNDDIEYLTNEFSIIKTTNERKVVKFYNKINRNSDKLNKLATVIRELYDKVHNLRRKMTDVVENHVEYEESEISELEKEMIAVDKEIDSVKVTIMNLLNQYPNSVFFTVYFQEKVGMNMSLSEAEVFCHQFEITMATVRYEMSQMFGTKRRSLQNSKRQLMRRPAFTMSDRKSKSGSKKIDEV